MANNHQLSLRPWSRFASLRSVIEAKGRTPEPSSAQNVADPSLKTSQPEQKNTSFILNNAKNNATKSQPATTEHIHIPNSKNENPNVNGNDYSLQNVPNKNCSSDSEEYSGIRKITIGGENKGAYMEIIQTRKKPNQLHKMENLKIKGYDDQSKKVRTISSPPMVGVYMNSNVQCVNNSLLLHASCTHHDPGVQLTISKKPFGKGFNIK